ncbi:hypothetical protein V8G54_025344 [Vigna mungo]|uniref:Uncharacterized protein n=1 Tax=Vigna mungo TaxID=3915 RepID=A0AAQ3MYK7_VIGMU
MCGCACNCGGEGGGAYVVCNKTKIMEKGAVMEVINEEDELKKKSNDEGSYLVPVSGFYSSSVFKVLKARTRFQGELGDSVPAPLQMDEDLVFGYEARCNRIKRLILDSSGFVGRRRYMCSLGHSYCWLHGGHEQGTITVNMEKFDVCKSKVVVYVFFLNSLLTHWNSVEFHNKCATVERNRASEKGGTLHIGGSIMVHENVIHMAQELERAVYVDEVFAQTHVRKGTSQFIDERS